jgi:hypothetical protein
VPGSTLIPSTFQVAWVLPPNTSLTSEHLVKHGVERDDAGPRIAIRVSSCPGAMYRSCGKSFPAPSRVVRVVATSPAPGAAPEKRQTSRDRSLAGWRRRSSVQHHGAGLQIAVDDASRRPSRARVHHCIGDRWRDYTTAAQFSDSIPSTTGAVVEGHASAARNGST